MERARFEGLSILKSNRIKDNKEVVHRGPYSLGKFITLAVNLDCLDSGLREKLWQHLCPKDLQCHDNDNLDFKALAASYDLTGRQIKSAWSLAASTSADRNNSDALISQVDLQKAAACNLLGRSSDNHFDRRTLLTRSLDDVIVSNELKSSLEDIVQFSKSQAILFEKWGFQKHYSCSKGIAALFYGPPGTGKSLSAETCACSLGRPIKMVNCAQLISKWMGESAKNIQRIFEEAEAADAVLVFDEVSNDYYFHTYCTYCLRG